MSAESRARQTLRAAHALADGGFLGDAVSRAYYAVFYAARAAVRAAGSDPGTHKGVATEFSRLLVGTGRAPLQASALLRQLATARIEADYDDGEGLSALAVAGLLSSAARFVDAVEGSAPAPPWQAFAPDQKRDLVAQLTREMEEASANLEFERAAELRDSVAQIEATLAA